MISGLVFWIKGRKLFISHGKSESYVKFLSKNLFRHLCMTIPAFEEFKFIFKYLYFCERINCLTSLSNFRSLCYQDYTEQ